MEAVSKEDGEEPIRRQRRRENVLWIA